MNTTEIEKQIRDYQLRFIPLRDPTVENSSPPIFAYTFNRVVRETCRVPSQDQFVEIYFEEHKTILTKILRNKEWKKALEARVRRTYPSLVRDLHFNALINEAGIEARYDEKLDVQDGIDHIITWEGKEVYLHCFVNTPAANLYRRLKEKRHSVEGCHVNLVVQLSKEHSKKVGDFYLYTAEHIEALRGILAEISSIKRVTNNKPNIYA